MRESGRQANDLLDRLAADERIPLNREKLDALIADASSFTGLASSQVSAVAERVAEVVAHYPDAAGYVPGSIL